MTGGHREIAEIGKEFTDPLYGICKIDEPFASTLLHPAIQKEIERLEGIKSLGLIFRFFPAGNHTKWEHYLGMYNVAKRVKYGLTKEEQEELQWLCLVGGFGHLPLTYLTASAFFLATMLSNDFKKSLKDFIRSAYRLCTACEDREYCFEEPAIEVFDSLNYKALRGSLSAYKLARLPKEVNIGHRDTLVRGCICPTSKLYRIHEAISRYDYMQRDLHHTGLAGFHMGYDEAFKTLADGIDALEESPSARLLDELYDYLVDSLYLRPDIACCESLLAKVLSAKLCAGEIDFRKVIEEYDDRSLMLKLQEVLGDSPVAYVQRRAPAFHIRRDLSINWFEAPNTVKLEMDLLGIKSTQKGKLQTYPDDYGLILSVYHMWEDPPDTSTFRIILNALQDNTKLYPVVATACRLQDRLISDNSQGGLKLAQEILSYAFGGRRIVYDDNRVRTALLGMLDHIAADEANAVIWEVHSILSNYVTRQDLPPVAMRFWRTLRHPSRRRDRPFSGDELKRLWDRMVRCLMSLASNPNVFGKSWRPVTATLKNLARSASNGTGEFAEALAYSAELVSAKKGKPKWVLPSVRLVTRGESQEHKKGDPQNEIDVVSIELLQDHIQIKLMECTESPSAVKATADHGKLERLKGILDSQKFQDLSVSIEVVSASRVGKDFVSIAQVCSRSRS